MGQLNDQVDQKSREGLINAAKQDYFDGDYSLIRSAASSYVLPYETLRDRVKGAKPQFEAHIEQQSIIPEQEKAIVRHLLELDEWGHPLKICYSTGFVKALLPYSKRRDVRKK